MGGEVGGGSACRGRASERASRDTGAAPTSVRALASGASLVNISPGAVTMIWRACVCAGGGGGVGG